MKNKVMEKIREIRNYKQIKSAYEELRNLLEDGGIKVYISGGIVPYLLLNQESSRLHDDIDTIARMEDMSKLREIFKKSGSYDSEWDSKTFTRDGEDYGFEVLIKGVPIGIYPFIYKDKKIVQYSYDPYTKQCKIKELFVEDLSDYIMTYRGMDERQYNTMSMEYIKFSKEQAHREKDIVDLKKIEEYGIRQHVYNRLQMFKQIQDIKAENLNFIKGLEVKAKEVNANKNCYEKEKSESNIEDKLQYFSKIQDYNYQMKLLNSIPDNEKYKFIGKIKSSQGIAIALNSLSDDESKSKTLNFIAKQFKGNNVGLLEILTQIDFDVTIPPNMLTFKLNNINALNLDFLINIQKHAINHSEMKFKINEYESDSINIEYSFSEMSAIIAKIEELTADIPKEMDEANKFYTIYSRIVEMMTYDYNSIRKEENAMKKYEKYKTVSTYKKYEKEMKKIRKKPAGLYGGLIDGKAICAGYALILHEALKYVGMKSQYVVGYSKKAGHAWNQVQIDGKWYNADPTWDASSYQFSKKYQYMLLSDEDFDMSHGEYSIRRTKTYHKCKSKFDYSKIQGLSPNQIENVGKDANEL